MWKSSGKMIFLDPEIQESGDSSESLSDRRLRRSDAHFSASGQRMLVMYSGQ